MTTPPVLSDAVLSVISPHLGASIRAGVEIKPDTDLWGAGMDSLASVAVMVAVEDEFDIEFPDAFLTREVFTSAANIAAAVNSIRAGMGGEG